MGSRDISKFDYLHILVEGEERFTVKGYGTYESNSVLAGQTMISFVDSFNSLQEAEEAYPTATLSNQYLEPINTYDHLPDTPDTDFDPYDY